MAEGTKDEVQRSIDVELDADEVWELLVDDEERAGWFGGPTTLDPVPGGAGAFTDPDGTRRHAVVDAVEPGRRLAWTWWPEDGDGSPSQVRIELSPAPGGGTRVGVVEAPLTPIAAATLEGSVAGVRVALTELEHRCLLRSSLLALA